MTVQATRWLMLGWFALGCSAGCSAANDRADVTIADSAASQDAAQVDGSRPDANPDDAGARDIGVSDGAFGDSGVGDAALGDAGVIDAGPKPWWRVLFIGNSYSSANSLPQVLARFSTEEQSPAFFSVDRRTPGGATWFSHDISTDVEQLIQQGWDYVILQDQSTQPWGSVGTKDELRSLDAKIKSGGGQTILYMTWARAPRIVPGSSLFRMNLAVNNYYERHGAAVDATVAPVGRAWERALRTPDLTLHAPDGTHPNDRGTYLAACVLYLALTGESPIGLGSGGLSVTDEERALLQRVAWQTHVARQRLPSPAIGSWPLSTNTSSSDLVPGERLVVGDAPGPDGSPGGATRFGYDGETLKAASLPYFDGMNTSEMTIAFDAHRADWNVATSTVQVLVAKSWGYRVEQHGSDLRASLRVVGSEQPMDLTYSTANLATGWHQIALSYDGATFGLWVDASPVASTAASGNIRYYESADTEDLRYNGIALGARFTDRFEGVDTAARDSGFTGALSNVRLFDRALSAAELSDL